MAERLETLETLRDGQALIVRFNRPHTLNAMNAQMALELEMVIRMAKQDPGVRAVIFTGNGSAFSSGADTGQFGDLNETQALAVAETGEAMIRELETTEKVTIAAINGAAIGGGCNFALACDFRLATRTARFGFPELRFNIPLGWNGMRRLVAAIGLAKAKDLLLTCRIISADEAHHIGLVDTVSESADLVAEAQLLASRIAVHGALAVSITKRYLHALAYGETIAGRFDRELTALGLRSEHFRRAVAELPRRSK